MAPIILASALSLPGVFPVSGEWLAQDAPEDQTLSGAPDEDTAISISAKVSLVGRKDAQTVAANTNFNDNRLSAEAPNGVVIDTPQKAAVCALSQAGMSGVRTGFVGVVAPVSRFAGDAALVEA